MSGPMPSRGNGRHVPDRRVPAEADGTMTVGTTRYRTRAGKPVGLDWDAHRADPSPAVAPAPPPPRPREPRPVDPRRAEALALYADGVLVADIAAAVGCHYRTIYDWLATAGIPLRGKGNAGRPLEAR